MEKVIDNTNILEIPGAPRNNHIVQYNLEVSSWTKSVKEKTEIGEYDDNIGEDSLSSQSIYAQDIESVKYLQCLCPSSTFLATNPVNDNIELKNLYATLFKAVYDFRVKRRNKSFLMGFNEQNKLVLTNIVQLVASSCVNCHGDIEFYEWARADTSHSIWSCHDIFQSPMIENAIKRLILKSANSEAASTLLCDKDRKTQYHFIGFVASHVKGNKLLGFHPSSFVIYYLDNYYNNSVVVCTMTSRHHILSNMQDRLLQLVQNFQCSRYPKIKHSLIITNECAPDVNINMDSRLSFESMGFDTSSVTQDQNTVGAIGITTENPIPIVQYGDRYTWAKYGYHVLQPNIE